MIKNKIGQLSLINIIFWVILVAVGAILTPTISQFISDMVNTTNATGITLILMQSIVPFFWLGIIITFFLYVTPIRPQQY